MALSKGSKALNVLVRGQSRRATKETLNSNANHKHK
jgi:hypothetical protein